MNRKCLAGTFVTAGLLLATVRPFAARQDTAQVFRGGTNAVSVDVSVQDRNRKALTGLKAADFEVYDNGVLQDVADVSYGRLPIDITVALDVSYSVSGLMLDRLQKGVVQLMKDLGRQDRLKLMLFNSRVARTVDFTNDAGSVEKAIKTAVAGGGTSLLDTISVSLVAAVPPDRRQLLMVFTDGGDSTSTTTPAMVTNVALRSRSTIAFVVPGPAGTMLASPGGTTVISRGTSTTTQTFTLGPARPFDALFRSLATSTGGAIVAAAGNTDLSVPFRQILTNFRSAYVLLYNARGVDRGGFHALEVKVKRQDATVVARRGYWN